MAVAGRGKRGGARLFYFWVTSRVQIHMLLAYSKTERDDLTEAQLRTLRDLVRQEFK